MHALPIRWPGKLFFFSLVLILVIFSFAFRPVSADAPGDSTVIAPGDAQGVADAIRVANQRGTDAAPYKIYLSAGDYTFYPPDQVGKPSLPEITGKLSMYGQQTRILLHTTDDALGKAQLRIAAGATVELRHVILVLESGSGRVILNQGALVIADSRFDGSAGEGGGIENQGNLTLERAAFEHNQYVSSTEPGTAILNRGTLNATCTRFVDGLASQGGAIFNAAGGTASISKSAFSGNRANGGGAIFSENAAPVEAANNWWSTGRPRVEDRYLGIDTVSSDVIFLPTAPIDPTQGAACQPATPEPLPAVTATPVVTATLPVSTATPALMAPLATGEPTGEPTAGPTEIPCDTSNVIKRVSVASDGTQGIGGRTVYTSISADNRYVAFDSGATNLVSGDTNNSVDIFVYDRQTCQTKRVSVASDGTQANARSWELWLSGNGRYVAFMSDASNLASGDTNGKRDIFLHDLQTGETERVSIASDGTQANGDSYEPSLSANGRYVVFKSDASNLVQYDTNYATDVFVHDRQTGQTFRVSVASDGTQAHGDDPVISADGRYVAFESPVGNLVPGVDNGYHNIFIHDLLTGETSRASVGMGGAQINGNSANPALSADGRYVAYSSEATNLVPGDTNAHWDIFEYDRQTGQTSRVSVSTGAVQTEGDGGTRPSISADGRYVAFAISASDVVTGDTNNATDVFVHDRDTNQTIRASVAADGTQGDGGSDWPSISADGRVVAFASSASNLVPGDTNGQLDAFVAPVVFLPWGFCDRSNVIKRVSITSDGTQGNSGTINPPAISADGRFTAFESYADNLVPNDTNGVADIFVHDRQTCQTARVSVASDGTQANAQSLYVAISANGRYVGFTSDASNLVSGDTNNGRDVFVHDQQTGLTERVSVASGGIQAGGTGTSEYYVFSISADGRFVAFASDASDLVDNDTNGQVDVFLRDWQGGWTERVSVASDGTQANGFSTNASLSADGRYVAFTSAATNLVPGDTNNASDVFVHDWQTGQTTRVSVDDNGVQGDGSSLGARISANGRFVTFESLANNLVPNDTNSAFRDLFVRDTQTGQTFRVNTNGSGVLADAESGEVSISADGHRVGFTSNATNLVPGDTNGQPDYFVKDWLTGQVIRASVSSTGEQSNGATLRGELAADGSSTALVSIGSNLVPGENNGQWHVYYAPITFLPTIAPCDPRNVIKLISAGPDGTPGNDDSGIWIATSADGRYIGFQSLATNLVPGDTNTRSDVFVYDQQTCQMERVSSPSDGIQEVADSYGPSLSADGRYMAFSSWASNLMPGDTNRQEDIFVRDLQTGQIERVSVGSGGQEGNGESFGDSLSADGRYVAFISAASNLVPGDTNAKQDVFVYDRQTQQTTRVSVASDGTQSNDHASRIATISWDGRYVAFVSWATNLVSGDTNNQPDAFVHDRQTGQTFRISVDGSGAQLSKASDKPIISSDGRFVVFDLLLTPIGGSGGPFHDILVYDMQTGHTARANTDSSGVQANGDSDGYSISGDGRYVSFASFATNLVPGDTNGLWDIFVKDRATGRTTRVSVNHVGVQSNGTSFWSQIAADGHSLALDSLASNFTPVGNSGKLNIFYFPIISSPSTFVVTNTNDSGAGSLRQAILDANASFGLDTITFNIPGTGVQTIAPRSALPEITDPVIIDGYTQPGAARATETTPAIMRINLNGNGAGTGADGLRISAGNSIVRGLTIAAFANAQIHLITRGQNRIEGNYIGTNVTGTSAVTVSSNGIIIETADNIIGTDGDGVLDISERNLISGHLATDYLTGRGVWITGSAAVNNRIAGNYIGTDVAGNNPIPNSAGVYINNGAQNNIIGTNGDGSSGDAAERNVISGNTGDIYHAGVEIKDAGTNGNRIAGNYIGINAAGTAALRNIDGVLIDEGSQNLVGTNADGVSDVLERNVISGNQLIGTTNYSGHGVFIAGYAPTGNRVSGNYIGTDPTGTIAIPNGIGVEVNGTQNVVGTPGLTSGNNAVMRNVISGNGGSGVGYGVRIYGVNANHNRVSGNYIGTDATGAVVLGNVASIYLDSDGGSNIIGTDGDGVTDAEEGNLISQELIIVHSNGNRVSGNYIGTDATGTIAFPSLSGVYVNSASNNIIGTNGDGVSDMLERNIIVGNSDSISIAVDGANSPGWGANDNRISGNYIGTDVTGTVVLGNGYGITIGIYAAGNVIGTNLDGVADLVEGNVIGGSAAQGITIRGSTTTHVAGNYIGVARDGHTPLPNKVGILIYGYPTTNNSVGGTSSNPAEQNQIAFNTNEGVRIEGYGVTGNRVLMNSIHDNGGLGIALIGSGNNGQVVPGLTEVTSDGTNKIILVGTVTGLASAAFRLEFFSNSTCDPSGGGEGETYFGSTNVTTNSSGSATYNVNLTAAVSPGTIVTATATGPDGTSAFSQCYVAVAPNYAVINTNDNGPGSLRQAILYANIFPGQPTITFNIPGTGVQTIALLSPLPEITDPLIIDGYTQPGALVATSTTPARLLIELNGTSAGASASGLVISVGNSTVRGLVINRFGMNGIQLTTHGGNTIVGNYIGTDPGGTIARGNNPGGAGTIDSAGVLIGVIGSNLISSNNVIGGTTPAARNVIASNTDCEILVFSGSHTVIQGNYIGTNATGTALVGSSMYGIYSFDEYGQIGGTAPGAGNVVSGSQWGIAIAGTIQGNFVGTNATGTAALGGSIGIVVTSSETGSPTIVGGPTPGARNIISGHDIAGITIIANGAVTVQNNYIGTDITGVLPLGNGLAGIVIDGSSNNIIGGSGANEGNRIAYNGNGVLVTRKTPEPSLPNVNNLIVGNAIYGNVTSTGTGTTDGLGINLSPQTYSTPPFPLDGVTANDPGDADTGPNGLQNFPVLNSAATDTSSQVTVNGALNSLANTNFRLEFFANTTCNPSGNGEGETYLGFREVTTNTSGDVDFDVVLSGTVQEGAFISATATGPDGTSEFSACLVAFNTPINTNLARNGDFASGTAQWSLYGEVSAAVTSGVMNLSRQNPSPTGALIYQDTNYQAQAGFPLEVSVDLGNSSSVTKQLTVYLRRPDWGEAFNCVFTLAPNTSLTTYRLRAKTSTAWSNMHLELAPDPADNLPAILVDNVNVQYKPSLNPTGVECVVPVAPANVNLVRNGTFASGTAQWSLYGEVSATVTGGVMNLSRQNPSPTGALIYQDTNYQALTGSPLEVAVDLGNSSSVPKQLTVYLRRPDWTEAFRCVFNLAPGAGLATYTLRAKTSTAWPNMHLELAPDPADNAPAIQVDNVNVQYKPSLNPSGVECSAPGSAPANVNLARNGDFASGTAQWGLYGEVSATVVSGVMNLYRQNPSPNGALIYQDTNFQALTGSSLEVAVDLGNSSSVPKQLSVRLRRLDWGETFSCAFNLAPNTGLATYTLRAKTSTAWPNMHLEVIADPADNTPAILVDNVNVQYKPSLNPVGVECTTTPAPANANLVRNGDFALGTDQWGLYGEVNATVTSGVMTLYRPSPSPTGALIYQDTNYQAAVGSPLELAVDLGNSSSVPKQMTLYLRRSDWNEAFSCVFRLAPNTGLTTYTLRAKTSTAWSNMHLELIADPADNTPAILVDNVNVQYKPSLNPVGVECTIPIAPANFNLVRNGDFALGTAQWGLYGNVSATVTSGVMNLYRQNPSPTGALIYQDTNFQALTGSPLEMTVNLGNSSSVPKQMTLYLRKPDWSEAFRCVFSLAPNTSLATYTLRAKTSTAWPNMHQEVVPDPADNLPAILVDNVNVQYKPSLNPVGVECAGPN